MLNQHHLELTNYSFPVDVYGNIPGFGFLRLHSTYRHDLKIYASDEGRVQMTAAAFAKVTTHIQITQNYQIHPRMS